VSRNTLDDVASAAVLQHAGSATAFADLGSSRRHHMSGLSLTVFEIESDQGKHINLMHVIAAPQHHRVMWLLRYERANAFTPTAIVQNETVKSGIQAACGIRSMSAVRASP
jgi:hypothetical protein